MLDQTTKVPKNPEKKEKRNVRKPYAKPVLETLGDLRTVTLGSSFPGSGDYSAPLNRAPFEP